MIAAMTSFTLPEPLTRERALAVFRSTAPTYQGAAGLQRKCYLLSEDGRTVSGFYVWDSRADAEAMYTPAWRAFVRDKYRCEPTVTYFDCPLVVDNVTQQIIIGAAAAGAAT